MKKGFTIIEIMIVIIIISVLLTVTMQFGSKRIDDLGYQAGKEQFLSAYDTLYSQAMTSNYREGIRYDLLRIAISSGTNPLSYVYDSGAFQTVRIATPMQISGLQMDANAIDEVYLHITPYTLGCELSSNTHDTLITGSTISFDLMVKGQKQYCFSIKNDTCKLIEQKCE